MKVTIESPEAHVTVSVELHGDEITWPNRETLREVFAMAEAGLGFAPEGGEDDG